MEIEWKRNGNGMGRNGAKRGRSSMEFIWNATDMGWERKGEEMEWKRNGGGMRMGWKRNGYGAETQILNIRRKLSDASLLTPIRNKLFLLLLPITTDYYLPLLNTFRYCLQLLATTYFYILPVTAGYFYMLINCLTYFQVGPG